LILLIFDVALQRGCVKPCIGGSVNLSANAAKKNTRIEGQKTLYMTGRVIDARESGAIWGLNERPSPPRTPENTPPTNNSPNGDPDRDAGASVALYLAGDRADLKMRVVWSVLLLLVAKVATMRCRSPSNGRSMR
jgi:hypothetical protein